MNCKVNGIPVNENTLNEMIAQYGINLSIEFEKEKNEQDFFNDFNLHGNGIHPSNMLSAISSVCKTDKISAVKIARYCTGWNLKESKEFVEHLMTL